MRKFPDYVRPVVRSLGLNDDEAHLERYAGIVTEIYESTGSITRTVQALQSSKAVFHKLDRDLQAIVDFSKKGS